MLWLQCNKETYADLTAESISNRISKKKCTFHELISRSFRVQYVLVMEISIRGSDTFHLFQPSTNTYFHD